MAKSSTSSHYFLAEVDKTFGPPCKYSIEKIEDFQYIIWNEPFELDNLGKGDNILSYGEKGAR